MIISCIHSSISLVEDMLSSVVGISFGFGGEGGGQGALEGTAQNNIVWQTTETDSS